MMAMELFQKMGLARKGVLPNLCTSILYKGF
jgi:hypothetical protein